MMIKPLKQDQEDLKLSEKKRTEILILISRKRLRKNLNLRRRMND